MAESLGPIAIDCDAPPYSIVQACHRIGIHSAEDVRWSRIARAAGDLPWWQKWFSPRAWTRILGMNQRGVDVCVCGAPLPLRERYTFLFITGEKRTYLLGQCPHCSTIFWEDGESDVAREEGLRNSSSR
jgi:hypothetical protein